jgi:hypothetical protein
MIAELCRNKTNNSDSTPVTRPLLQAYQNILHPAHLAVAIAIAHQQAGPNIQTAVRGFQKRKYM